MDKNTLPKEVEFRGVGFEWGKAVVIVPPLSVRQYEDQAEVLDKIADTSLPFSDRKLMMKDIILLALKRNYPEASMEDLRDMCTVDNMTDYYSAATGGFRKLRKIREAGEFQPTEQLPVG